MWLIWVFLVIVIVVAKRTVEVGLDVRFVGRTGGPGGGVEVCLLVFSD